MTAKTEGESIFEEFCALNSIACKKIAEGEQPTPDYEVLINDQPILVEVKQIDEDDNFSEESGSRRVGSHIRKKIEQARKQAQTASNEGKPFICWCITTWTKCRCLVPDNMILSTQCRETTLVFDKTKNAITDSFQGRNRSLGDEKNTSFSAVGNLRKTHRGIEVRSYENIFAKHKIDFSKLPTCIEAQRIES